MNMIMPIIKDTNLLTPNSELNMATIVDAPVPNIKQMNFFAFIISP